MSGRMRLYSSGASSPRRKVATPRRVKGQVHEPPFLPVLASLSGVQQEIVLLSLYLLSFYSIFATLTKGKSGYSFCPFSTLAASCMCAGDDQMLKVRFLFVVIYRVVSVPKRPPNKNLSKSSKILLLSPIEPQ